MGPMPRDQESPPNRVECLECSKAIGEGELYVELKQLGKSGKGQGVHWACLASWMRKIARAATREMFVP